MALRSNIKQFLEQTNKAIEKELEKQESEGKKIVITAYDAIVNGSAIDTGLFRTSHIISYNKLNSEIPTNPDVGRISTSKLSVGAFKFNNGDFIAIQSNLSYSEALEGGSSKQQPPALYGRTREQVKRLLNQRIK